ncbi:hypothetical protein ERO13_A05G414250v2 [Gossypium hirsutum]|nr:hypothetical protein ERO13_A05G414250v2 [Gossypium hirsutum]
MANIKEIEKGKKIDRFDLFKLTHLNAETHQIVEKGEEKLAEFRAIQPSEYSTFKQAFKNELFIELTEKRKKRTGKMLLSILYKNDAICYRRLFLRFILQQFVNATNYFWWYLEMPQKPKRKRRCNFLNLL